jgi:SnoaL-like domain
MLGSVGNEADVAIDRLLRRYADIASRQAWPEFSEVVAADARIRFTFTDADLEVSGPEGLARLGQAAMVEFAFYIYVPLNHVAEVHNATTATGRAYALESALDRAGRWLDIYGLYEDQYGLRDGRWMIAGRHYRELHRQMR